MRRGRSPSAVVGAVTHRGMGRLSEMVGKQRKKSFGEVLKSALKAQPVSITVKADKDMQHYKSGVLSIPCNGSQINHAVLAVGYGFALSKGRHVKVKNSWGTTWGDGGYMLMDRRDSVNPSCVYNDAPVYPVLA